MKKATPALTDKKIGSGSAKCHGVGDKIKNGNGNEMDLDAER